MWRHYFR